MNLAGSAVKVWLRKLLALERGQRALLDEEVGQAQALLRVVAGGVAQVEQNLAGSCRRP